MNDTTPRTTPPNTGSLAIDVCRVWAALATDEKVTIERDGYPNGLYWNALVVVLQREMPDVEFFTDGSKGEFGGLSAQRGANPDLEVVLFKWDRATMRVNVSPVSEAAKTRMREVLEREP